MRMLTAQRPGRRRIEVRHPDGRVWVRYSSVEAARVIQAILGLSKIYADLEVTVSGEPVSYAVYGRWSRRGYYPPLPPPNRLAGRR